jgi:hypothetical protein
MYLINMLSLMICNLLIVEFGNLHRTCVHDNFFVVRSIDHCCPCIAHILILICEISPMTDGCGFK